MSGAIRLKETVSRNSHSEFVVDRIRGFYFYTLGSNIRVLRTIVAGDSLQDRFFPLSVAKNEMDALVNQRTMPLRTSLHSANELLNIINVILAKDVKEYKINYPDVFSLNQAISTFEIAYNAENSVEHLFYVTPKGGYDSGSLIEMGEVLFPSDLSVKVPSALNDVRAAGRCIAFELGTAAGFHLLRALESVLLAYRKQVIPGNIDPDPNNRNLGAYIKEMETSQVGDKKILQILRQIKDLHRNPLLHPEDHLNVEEAIRLLGIVVSAIGAMLDQLPGVQVIQSYPVPVVFPSERT